MSTLLQNFSDVVFWSNVLAFIFVSIVGCVWAIFAHEMSHVLLAAKFRIKKNLAWWKIKPYPHYDDRLGHVWASAHWRLLGAGRAGDRRPGIEKVLATHPGSSGVRRQIK
jgi:hypothetical protein